MSENVAIAIIAPVQPQDYYDELWEGVWEATFDLAAFGVRVENLTTESCDIARQREILADLVDSEIAAIGIVPAHASALDDLIDEHERRGRRVITFHADAPESARSAFVGAAAQRGGQLAAEVLAKLMGGRGQVVSCPGDQEEFRRSIRHAGFCEELERYGGSIRETALILDSADFANALKSADGIYVGGEELVRVAAALEENGARVPCVALGNTPEARRLLERGLVSAVIDESRHQQGYFTVQAAYQATINRDALKSIFVPSTVAFSANAAELQQSLNDAFELLVRKRTEVLVSYKNMLEKANAELLSLSITDPLTGLINRRQFETALGQEAARAHRHGSISLLMIDADLFKSVNDTYGHQAGDEALKTIARVLTSSCRGTDICARLGGDEFAIILPHSDAMAAGVVRDRIVGSLANSPIAVGAEKIHIGVSIGIGTLPGDADYVDGLIAAADADMYRVKQASRTLVEVPR